MMSLFTPKLPTPFKPVLAPLPPRAPCDTTCNQQYQSPFFGRLPAEIRIEVYEYIFVAEARELLSVEAHPLSMLLTCRKANREANYLAFERHTFPISDCLQPTSFVCLRIATANLSSQQVNAITALSYNQRRKCVHDNVSDTANIIANTIFLFPHLQKFEIRNLRSSRATLIAHSDTSQRWPMSLSTSVSAMPNYAPLWFTQTLESIVYKCASARQLSEPWTIEWPQLEQKNHLHFVEYTGSQGNPVFTPSICPDKAGIVRGVQMCPLRPGNVEWTSADLVHESGRRIAVDFVYHGPEDRPVPKLDGDALLKARIGPKAFILKEGATPLTTNEDMHESLSTAATSLEYKCDEAYWEELRSRNGNLGAMCRSWWRTLTQRSNVDKLPGSKSLGEGDWARMKESAEIEDTDGAHVADEAEGKNRSTHMITRCKMGSVEER